MSVSTVEQIPGGDVFRVELYGLVNGKEFSFVDQFPYSDLRYMNFPAENREYSARIARQLDRAAAHVLEAAQQ